MRVAIVGASGALGQMIGEGVELSGWTAIRVNRSAGAFTDVIADVLASDPASALPQDVDAVVYLAWATRDRSDSAQRAHVIAAHRWARHAAECAIPFIFAGSTLSSSVSRSSYARHKWDAEELVLRARGTVARIGLVVDDAYPSLVATSVRRLARRIPSVARLLDWPVFPLAGNALVSGLCEVVESGSAQSRIWLAETATASLADIATWQRSAPTGGAIVHSLGRLATRLRAPESLQPRILDAWTGLVTGPVDVDPEFLPSPVDLVATGGWRTGAAG